MDFAGPVAVLILALFWAVLVAFLAFVLIRLGGVLKSTEELIDGVTDKTVPLLGEVNTSVVLTNHQLERVDAITDNVQTITTNAASLVSLFGATLGGPLVKVAAFTYGVRKAAGARNKAEVEKRVKTAMKDERRAARVERKQARAKRKAT
jgi:uncharacterized protein YoxC